MQLLTRKDYDFYECSSALQKSIRRGVEKDALFFGMEIYSSGYSKYAWKRILLIASEDIGLANNDVSVQINALYNNWKDIKEMGGTHGDEAVFIHAIMILSRSKKSRVCDHAKIYAMTTGENPEIPDYALDGHTRKGKIKGRKHDFFIKTGALLENKEYIPDPYEEGFNKYLMDYDNGVIKENGFYGYDKRNVHHNTTKAMNLWKLNNSQSTMDM